ncbi:MAG TPA: UvrD-helicase domain-containing protein [Candidatus Paceibacterota bacterium]|nr:UvrD-helicase domain-containing protein [Candidatus Paceibacterota bacterium]HMO83016.1 UvrD-helicase domain-containing protein [Candidatus Paceibacterota bacterium]
MPLGFEVTDENIAEAERILLPEGASFGEQARDFIRNWNDIDLQAVPGSGKTTVLLAKLLILDRHLDFHPELQGVLIISHTNTAVNEIKDRIGSECKHLFNAPNFIGTIQSFVDTFLAKPYFATKYGTKLSRVDDDTYYSAHRPPSGAARVWVEKNPQTFYGSRLSEEDNLVKGFPPTAINLNMTTPTALGIQEVKLEIRNRGIISYDEAYLLAFSYIEKYPKIKDLLRKRFKYIFIDEVQDMSTAQYSILETLFYIPGTSDNVYQRVGDQNQAIYNDADAANNSWENRAEILRLENSQRLSPNIARVVQPFGLQTIDINGCRTSNDSESNIKPVMIIYDNDSIASVIESYTQIIAEHKGAGRINAERESHIAIGWTTESDPEKGHIKLDAYFSDFQKTKKLKKHSQQSIEGAIMSAIFNSEKTGKKLRSNLMDIFLYILRLEGVKKENGHYYNSLNLIQYLKDLDEDKYELYKEKLVVLSFLIAQAKKDQALQVIRDFVIIFLSWFEKEVSGSRTYLTSEYAGEPVELAGPIGAKNIYEGRNGICVNVCTIHSVKGQTHTSVLYLDTFYFKYESEKLSQQICGQPFMGTTGVRKIQATKMMYVGFSRPTHLLCYAVHRNNYDAQLSAGDLGSWDIVELDGIVST